MLHAITVKCVENYDIALTFLHILLEYTKAYNIIYKIN